MRKYNPALKGMVDNFREKLAKTEAKPQNYSDEELYAVIDYWSGTSSYREQFESVYDDVLGGTKR